MSKHLSAGYAPTAKQMHAVRQNKQVILTARILVLLADKA